LVLGKASGYERLTKSQEPRAKSQEPRAKSQEPRAKTQEPRAKSQEPRAKNQEPKTSATIGEVAKKHPPIKKQEIYMIALTET
jgi:hypothetical protein